MSEPTELMPCPFCGGVAHIADDLITFYGECGTCGATSDYSSYKAGAVASWNRRTTTPQPTQPQAGAVPLTDEQIDAAAKKLAECMEYPWEFMPEPGRKNMRKHAQDVIDAAHGIKGGQHGD